VHNTSLYLTGKNVEFCYDQYTVYALILSGLMLSFDYCDQFFKDLFSPGVLKLFCIATLSEHFQNFRDPKVLKIQQI
jgi:hypothetical protein